MGDVPRKRHTQFRQPDGSLYAEELMGREGFSGPSALLYHRHPPTAITDAATWEIDGGQLTANRPLKPRHFRTHKLDLGPADLVQHRQLIAANDDVRLAYAIADRPSPLYRNSVGDECVFVEAGHATLETVFGALDVGPGDYVVIPTSTTHRWIPRGDGGPAEPLRALVIESAAHVDIPRRYRTANGQLAEHAPYCERDLRAPSSPLSSPTSPLTSPDGDGPVDVFVRHRGGGTRYRYAHHPFDVVGWDGSLYPYALNIADFEPMVGRVHLPPPVHQTFEAPGFVVCSFCPRPFDFDPLAIPAPYNHANVDSDEVLFYVGGDFMSRADAGIETGSVTLHPAGFIHGPQPGAVEGSIGKPGTGETAVMVDTFRPLHLGPGALASEDPGYAWTWLPQGEVGGATEV